MPENPKDQNPDWNADGQPQADQDPAGHHGEADGDAPQRSEDGPAVGRDRPPADADRKRSPWMGGG
jgi:hypothetical protein